MIFTPLMSPATCELCGQWMPGHSSSCPRSGVHPSQWTMNIEDPMNLQEYKDDSEIASASHSWSHVYYHLPDTEHDGDEYQE